MIAILKNYKEAPTDESAEYNVKQILTNKKKHYTLPNLRKIFGFIDLTTLKTTDGEQGIKELAQKLNGFHSIPRHVGTPNVAAICIYPSLLNCLRKKLTARGVKIVSVAGGFPSSQTYTKIKIAEAKMAVVQGAEEIDIVMPVGKFLEKKYDYVYNEIAQIKRSIGKVHLKVILETGALESTENIWNASLLAMEAGCDFIKTSTGMLQPAATPRAFWVMAEAVKAFAEKNKKQIGIKAAGGISTGDQAVEYFAIVEEVLGGTYLNPEFFRIGASKLANNLLKEIIMLKPYNSEQLLPYF